MEKKQVSPKEKAMLVIAIFTSVLIAQLANVIAKDFFVDFYSQDYMGKLIIVFFYVLVLFLMMIFTLAIFFKIFKINY